MKVVPFFKIYNFDVVQKFIWSKDRELILKTKKRIWIQRKLVFFNEISLQTWADLKSFLPSNKCTEFCKSTLHKSYNCTTYSNITTERTLHKIIITHRTFYIYKKILFQVKWAHDAYNECNLIAQTPRVSQPSPLKRNLAPRFENRKGPGG